MSIVTFIKRILIKNARGVQRESRNTTKSVKDKANETKSKVSKEIYDTK